MGCRSAGMGDGDLHPIYDCASPLKEILQGVVIDIWWNGVVGMNNETAAHVEYRFDLLLQFCINRCTVVGGQKPDVQVAAECEAITKGLRNAWHIHSRLDLHGLKTVHARIDETGNKRLNKPAGVYHHFAAETVRILEQFGVPGLHEGFVHDG